jgi:trk system potassium uptake protein TrkA
VNIVVVGGGLGGYHIASLFSEEKHSVVIIEQSEAAIENVRRYLDIKAVMGSGTRPRVLKEAEVQRADLLIAITGNDETNMVTCFLAKELGAKRTVARVRNPEYTGYVVGPSDSAMAPRRVFRPKTVGIDLFINPDIIAAADMVNILSSSYTTPLEEFAGGRVQVRGFRVENEHIVNKSICEVTFPKPCLPAVVVRPKEVIIPAGDTTVKGDDRVWVVASKEAMDELGAVFSERRSPARSIIILGGEHVGFRLAQELERRDVRVKLFESDAARSQELAAQLTHVEVVQGGGTDSDFLIEEGVSSADAFVATTRNDELNILTALLAKNLGASRSLVQVERPQYIPLAEAVGVDVAVSPLLLAASRIVQQARSDAVVSMALLAGSQQMAAIEFIINQSARVVNKTVADIVLPKQATIGAIVRESTTIIPPTDEVIQPGDHVIIVCLQSLIITVEKLFE